MISKTERMGQRIMTGALCDSIKMLYEYFELLYCKADLVRSSQHVNTKLLIFSLQFVCIFKLERTASFFLFVLFWFLFVLVGGSLHYLCMKNLSVMICKFLIPVMDIGNLQVVIKPFYCCHHY